jgi:RNA polymerase sigma-70 factor (ECF subfamily)
MDSSEQLILAARGGDLAAYGQLVEQNQSMVFAVCRRVLTCDADALDAMQECFIRAFRRIDDLHEPAAWPGWLRRIAITIARDAARRRRLTFVPLIDVPDVPVLDDAETSWTETQRHALAKALLTLTAEDRRLCDRFYHGSWTTARLAKDESITEPAMRKRLQRIRDRLRQEIEMQERRPEKLPSDLPAQIIQLLSRPNLTDLPDNPVGRITELLLARYPQYQPVDAPEIIDTSAVIKLIGTDSDYLPDELIHQVSPGKMLRYDMTMPLLLASQGIGSPARLTAVGTVYRNQTPNAKSEQAFHQLEVLIVDQSTSLDPWAFLGQTLQILADLLPGRNLLIEEVKYPTCSKAWEVSVDVDGKTTAVLACGAYADNVLRHLGADPLTHTSLGVSYGLERMAAVHFGYDDIRKLSAARV